MAIDMIQLVRDQLEPVLLLDPTLEAAIPRQVDAQLALQRYPINGYDDSKAVYVSVRATKALIPRLLLKFSQEVQEAEAGPAKAKFADAVKFLEALQKEMADQAKAAAWEADPEDTVGEVPKGPRSTLAGMRPL